MNTVAQVENGTSLILFGIHRKLDFRNSDSQIISTT
jgi:hypothetical protein